MAKIFSTEKLSLNGDNIRLEASQNGELKILDSDNNVLQSNRTVDSDISSLATASSLEGNRRDSDVSSLANTVTTNDSDLSSLAISDQKHDSDVSSLAISASGSTEQLDSDISSLATASSLEGNRRDSDVSSLANTVTTNDSDLSSLAISDQKHDSDVSSLAISASGSTEQLDSDISSLATASSLESVTVVILTYLAWLIQSQPMIPICLVLRLAIRSMILTYPALAISASGSTEQLDSDISSLATASSLESVTVVILTYLAWLIQSQPMIPICLVLRLAIRSMILTYPVLAISASGSTEQLDSDISSLATASSLESVTVVILTYLAWLIQSQPMIPICLVLRLAIRSMILTYPALAISASGSTEQLDSDISSLATASSLEGNRRDSDVSSLALDISTNDVYVNSYQINTTNAPNIDSYVVNYAAAGFTSAPTVVATMMATGVNDPIIGVQLSGNPTTTQATFVFSDDIPGTGYYLEFLASV